MKSNIEITRTEALSICDLLTCQLRDLGNMRNCGFALPGGHYPAKPMDVVKLWRKERRYFVARQMRAFANYYQGDTTDAREKLAQFDQYATTVAGLVPLIAA